MGRDIDDLIDRARFQKLPALLVLISNIARAGSQWVLVWVYAILGGSVAVGEYSLALAIATPIFIAAEMSLRNVYVTLHRPIAFSTYVLVRTISCAVALTLLVLASGLNVISVAVLLLVGLIKTVDSVLDLSYGVLQKEGMLARIALTSLLNSGLTVLIGVVAYRSTRSIELSLVGSLIGSVCTAAIVVIPVARARREPKLRRGEVWPGIRGVLHAGIPSGLAFASVSLLTYLPVYFLSAVAGKEQIGVFAVLAYFPIFANLFYSSVQQSTLHTFVASHGTGGNTELRGYALRIGRPLILCGLVSGILTMSYGNQFVTAVYGDQFSLEPEEIWPVAVSLVLLPLIYVSGAVLLTKNLYRMQFAIGSISLALSVGVGLLSLNRFDLSTASLLVLIGTGCRGLLGWAAATYSLRKRESGRAVADAHR